MLASAAVLALSFNACSSDDSGGGVSEEKLVGKWEYSTQKFSAAGQTTGEQPYDDNQEGCAKDYITFNADGTFSEGDYWNSACDLSTNTGDWTLNGKQLVADGETYTVVSVSNTKLKIKMTYTEGGINWVDQYTFTKAD